MSESESKHREEARELRKSVAAIAASSVDGYLRNASRRLRVPIAEGNRGTRRKMAMVVSANVDHSTAAVGSNILAGTAQVATTSTVVNDVDDEWDEVDLPVTSAKLEMTAVKKDEFSSSVQDESSSFVKAAVDVVTVKADETAAQSEHLLPPPPVLPKLLVKPEQVASMNGTGEDAWSTVHHVVDDDHVDNEIVMRGARAPLTEQQLQPQQLSFANHARGWRVPDPAYEAMLEQRDLLTARRRSERMQSVSESIVCLIAVLLRGRLMWRGCHDPALFKALLRLHTISVVDDAPSRKKRKTSSSSASAASAQTKPHRVFFMMDAVKAAKELAVAVGSIAHRKLSLAPTWVTAAKDGAKNKTSEAITVLLKAIQDNFVLTCPADDSRTAANGDASGAPVVDGPTSIWAEWSSPLTPGWLHRVLCEHRSRPSGDEQKIPLPHPAYFTFIFLALAALAGFDCRLVIAKQNEKQLDAEEDKEDGTAAPKPEKLSIFANPKKTTSASSKRGRSSTSTSTTEAESEELKSRKLPTSCIWAEVWSAARESFIAVNPCKGCATLWGAPHTFSIGPDVAVDATPRYISKFSSAFAYNRRLGRVRQFGFLWQDTISWDSDVEIVAVLLRSFCPRGSERGHTRQRTLHQCAREARQLESLAYSESVPVTLSALHRHPLFVIESDMARHEGIYPKDSSTLVGSVKGHNVYKRSAVVILRSMDGWLREGRSLLSEAEEPYKTVPPPASRPFSRPSLFYGHWQTKLFEPLPLRSDGSVPHHGRTSWYVLMQSPAPDGLLHINRPQIARVARRMQLDMGLAVTGFNRKRVSERRRSSWEAVIEGVVVKTKDAARLLRAYEEWIQLVQEQEAARRRERALKWWLLLSQRMLALERLQQQYMRGASRGGMPTM